MNKDATSRDRCPHVKCLKMWLKKNYDGVGLRCSRGRVPAWLVKRLPSPDLPVSPRCPHGALHAGLSLSCPVCCAAPTRRSLLVQSPRASGSCPARQQAWQVLDWGWLWVGLPPTPKPGLSAQRDSFSKKESNRADMKLVGSSDGGCDI